MIMEDTPAVILDCGTSFCRAGFSNDMHEYPPVVIPNVVGRPRFKSSNASNTHFIGDSALAMKKELDIRLPMEYGHVTRWEEMQVIWQALIDDQLGVQPSDHPFLLVQPCNVSSYNLEKTVELFFENWEVPSLCLMPSVLLDLLASGLDTGIAVEIGGGACFCVPVLNGYRLRHLQQRTEFSGRDLTATLSKMIAKKMDLKMQEEIPFDIVNTIKEKYCYCAKNYEEECNLFSKEKEVVHQFSSENGETREVTVGIEQFRCPESLFKPGLADKEFPGLHDIVLKCLMVEDEGVKNELASNILLCGGSSLFPGLGPRLQNELEVLSTAMGCNRKIKVSVSPFRHAAYQGGKLAARSPDFLKCCMSREHYEENGPSGIKKLFF